MLAGRQVRVDFSSTCEASNVQCSLFNSTVRRSSLGARAIGSYRPLWARLQTPTDCPRSATLLQESAVRRPLEELE